MLNITSTLNHLIKVTIFFILMGILFADRVFIMLSQVIILFILLGLLLDQPREIKVNRIYTGEVILTNEIFTIDIDYEINRGLGIVALVDELPGELELIEGTNFKLIWKGLRPKKETMQYRVRSTTAGLYHLNKLAYETYHFLNLKAPIEKKVPGIQKIEIRPRLLEIKKIRDVSTKSKIPLPLGAMAKMGIPTLEFRELRQYQRGDPFKYINWKATARNTGSVSERPLVNEYEKEGKKTVWLFLDRSPSMYFGANVKNAFECALETVNGLADYYLKQDCRVALCTFNGASLLIYPAAGKRQYHKILQELLQFKNREEDFANENIEDESEEKPSASKRAALRETVVKYKGYLYGSNPLCVVITRLTRENTSALSDGIKELMKYTGISKDRYSIMVANISGYDLAAVTYPEKMAAEILKKRDQHYSIPLKKGIAWIDWNPSRYSFTTAMLRQVVKR